jgi:hypothetical protein
MIVEEDGLPEHRTTVDDPVPGRLELRVLINEGAERIAHVRRVWANEILGCDHPVCVVQQAELEAARTGVDDEDVHLPTMPDRAVRSADRRTPTKIVKRQG